MTLTWQPAPFRIEVAASVTGVPLLDQLGGGLALTAAGLDALDLTVGPVPLPVGPVELRPVLAVHAGAHPDGGRRVELGLDLDGTRSVAAQWLLDPMTLQLAVLSTDPPVLDPGQVALALAEAVTGLAASIALATDEVQHLLDLEVGATHVRELLHGVAAEDRRHPRPHRLRPRRAAGAGRAAARQRGRCRAVGEPSTRSPSASASRPAWSA